MWLDLVHAEMRVGCCQKQDLRDGEDFQDGLVWGWRLLSESGFGGWGDFRVPDNRKALANRTSLYQFCRRFNGPPPFDRLRTNDCGRGRPRSQTSLD